MPPLEGVGLGRGDESERSQFPTLPSTAPVFATQPVLVKLLRHNPFFTKFPLAIVSGDRFS